MKTCLFLLLAACAGFFLTAQADTLSPYDTKFVKAAAQSSLNEVKLAELGVQKALDPEVKALAGFLVKERGAAHSDLKALSEKKRVEISASIDPETAETFKLLEKKSGADFDQDFVIYMDKAHFRSMRSYLNAKKEAQDADLKTWVDKALDRASLYDYENAYWRRRHASQSYADAEYPYEEFEPAYRYGAESFKSRVKGTFEENERRLEEGWEKFKGNSRLTWERARNATRAAWHRLEESMPGDADGDGR